MFNFNDLEGWKKFSLLTSGSTLLNCLQSYYIEEDGRKWFKKFMNILHRSFKKIRIVSKNSFDILHNFMAKKAELVDCITLIKKKKRNIHEQKKLHMITKYQLEIENF